MTRALCLLAGLFILGALAGPASATPLYVSNSSDGTISPFSMNPDGSLTPLTCNPASNCTTGSDPEAEAIDPSGRFLYVATGGPPGVVSIFAIGAGGSLSPLPCSPASNCNAGSFPFGLALAPSGRLLYAANSGSNTVSAFGVGADGRLTPAPCVPTSNCNTGLDPAGVAVDPTERFVFVANDGADSISEFQIQPGGSLAHVACDPSTTCHTGSEPNGLKVTPNGRFLYVANIGSGTISIFAISPSGGLTPVSCSPASNCQTGLNPNDLAISASGRFLYASSYGSNSVSPFAINGDGTLTPMPCNPASNCATGSGPDGIAITPNGRFLYVANGAGQSVSVFAVAGDGTLTPVPCDPSTSCLTGLGPNFQSVAIPPDLGPTASFIAASARAGQTTNFDASSSSDPDGQVARFDWSFGDGTSAANAGPKPQHVYAKPGTYNVSVTVTDDSGCSTFPLFTGQMDLCNGSASATAEATSVVLPARPTISALSQSARRWREGKALPKVARKRPPLGTRFRFSLNEPARVHFAFTQRVKGHRVGKRCVRRGSGRRCTRTVTAGSFSFAGHSGPNLVRFQGRVSRRKKLHPGRYTLVVTAKDSGGASAARRSISFTIVKG